MTTDHDHFIRLAKAGRYAGASSGECHAFELTNAIVEHVKDLDAQAIAGLKEFIDLCAAMSPPAREVSGREVFGYGTQ